MSNVTFKPQQNKNHEHSVVTVKNTNISNAIDRMHTKDKPNMIELEFVEVKKHIKITFNFAKAFAVS